MRPSRLSVPGSRRDQPPLLGAIGSSLARPRMGNRARGLQRRRRRLALLSLRRRALTRLPLEGGRLGRPLRSRAAPPFRALVLGTGRDPILKERIFGLGGAGAQSRRGRQGILVVSRRHADLLLTTLALSLSTSQFPYARLRQENANRTRDRPGILASRRWRVRRRSILANHYGLRQGGTG